MERVIGTFLIASRFLAKQVLLEQGQRKRLMDGWTDGWMEGRTDGKAGSRLALGKASYKMNSLAYVEIEQDQGEQK